MQQNVTNESIVVVWIVPLSPPKSTKQPQRHFVSHLNKKKNSLTTLNSIQFKVLFLLSRLIEHLATKLYWSYKNRCYIEIVYFTFEGFCHWKLQICPWTIHQMKAATSLTIIAVFFSQNQKTTNKQKRKPDYIHQLTVQDYTSVNNVPNVISLSNIL